jgi:WD40 repeat protein
VVSGSNDKTLRVWDLTTGSTERTITEHTEAIYALDVHPSLLYWASGSADGTVRVWACDHTPITTIQCGNRVDALRFSLQPDMLVVATKGCQTRCFNFLTGAFIRALPFKYSSSQFVFGCAVSAPMAGLCRSWGMRFSYAT